MARRITALAAFLSLAAFVSSADVKCPGTANYTMTFRGLWKKDRHPNADLPPGAHFSRLIGCSHGADYVMWRNGTKASPGVKLVAETGETSTLQNEITAQLTMKKAWQLILSSGGTGAEGVITGIPIQVTSNFSKVSVITMLAPSPDWIIGIDSLDMCDNGAWRESYDVTMSPPWDAGTDDGQQFRGNNAPSNPFVNIFQITNNTEGAFKNDVPIKSLGEFLFKSADGMTATPAPPMEKSSSTAMPTDSAVGKASLSFSLLVSATLILALLF
ncbi:hypothetical protein ACROYT_G039439 [Oculina patagonica]